MCRIWRISASRSCIRPPLELGSGRSSLWAPVAPNSLMQVNAKLVEIARSNYAMLMERTLPLMAA